MEGQRTKAKAECYTWLPFIRISEIWVIIGHYIDCWKCYNLQRHQPLAQKEEQQLRFVSNACLAEIPPPIFCRALTNQTTYEMARREGIFYLNYVISTATQASVCFVFMIYHCYIVKLGTETLELYSVLLAGEFWTVHPDCSPFWMNVNSSYDYLSLCIVLLLSFSSKVHISTMNTRSAYIIDM